jgi:hypothetical protein
MEWLNLIAGRSFIVSPLPLKSKEGLIVPLLSAKAPQ